MKYYKLLRFPDFKLKALTLSYDDGIRADVKLTEVLSENGIKATFNLNSGLFAQRDGEHRLSENEAKKLYDLKNFEVALHGERHLSLAEVSEDVAVRDIANDRQNLERDFGGIINGMAYANGSYNDSVVEILKKCGIKYARTTKSTQNFDLPEDWLRLCPTCHHNDPELMNLADKFINFKDDLYFWANSPKLFYLWGHSYEFDNNSNWEIIEKFAQKVGGKDDIWYATNGEIYDYVQAYNRLEYSINGETIFNPSVITVYLYYYGKRVSIKGGETVVVEL